MDHHERPPQMFPRNGANVDGVSGAEGYREPPLVCGGSASGSSDSFRRENLIGRQPRLFVFDISN